MTQVIGTLFDRFIYCSNMSVFSLSHHSQVLKPLECSLIHVSGLTITATGSSPCQVSILQQTRCLDIIRERKKVEWSQFSILQHIRCLDMTWKIKFSEVEPWKRILLNHEKDNKVCNRVYQFINAEAALSGLVGGLLFCYDTPFACVTR